MLRLSSNYRLVRLSLYNSVTQTKPIPITVADLSDKIITDRGELPERVKWYKTLRFTDSSRAKLYKAHKLPAYCPAGLYLRSKDKREMVEPSRLWWVDFDDVEDAASLRNELAKIPNCVLCYVSVSGHGVHGLFAASASCRDNNSYGKVWDMIVRAYIPDKFKQYLDPASRKIGQLAIISVDRDAHIKLTAEVPQIEIPRDKPNPNLALAHKKIGLPNLTRLNSADHAQRQLKIYSLIDRTRPPEDYPTWIRLLASLKSGGVSEGVAHSWSARGSNYHQKSFERAWKSLSPNGGVTIGTFIWWSQSQR